ncbi:MAG: histidinol-phosphatase [Alphaproteobacteria bacterium]|nr:histidinol-phosphatase [Alphaproteobacteria bacterium]
MSAAFTDFANTLADAAGGIARRYFRTAYDSSLKSDHTPVTIADKEIEATLRTMIEAEYPEHGIFGEETGITHREAEYLWVIDPIDGTRAFMAGKPTFTTLIALCRHGEPILGIIDQPIARERWIGDGRRTTLNGKAVRVRPCAALDSAIFSTTSPYLFSDQERTKFERIREAAQSTLFGSDAYAYALLASGCIDLVVESGLKPYDFAALIPVVEGAGGIITDWQGEKLSLNSPGHVIAAGDKALHGQALGLLK